MMKFNLPAVLSFMLLVVFQMNVFAGEPDYSTDPDYAQVVSVRMVYRSGETWDVYTAVLHNDEGWAHYADIWQVVDAGDGTILGERVLLHPHDTEQPFTRSLSGLKIPPGTSNILIRSRCNLHDYGGREIHMELPQNPEIGLELKTAGN